MGFVSAAFESHVPTSFPTSHHLALLPGLLSEPSIYSTDNAHLTYVAAVHTHPHQTHTEINSPPHSSKSWALFMYPVWQVAGSSTEEIFLTRPFRYIGSFLLNEVSIINLKPIQETADSDTYVSYVLLVIICIEVSITSST